MARLKKGLLGPISGAIGTVEGYELKGQFILRSKRNKPDKPPTEKQLACRAKMRLVNSVLSHCKAFIELGYAEVVKIQTYNAYNAAVAYNMQHAIIGIYPNYEIAYSQLKLAAGTIDTEGLSPSVSLQGNTLTFSWAAASAYPSSTDHVLLLAYAPQLKQAVFNLCGAKRRAAAETLTLPQSWQATPMHCYIAFRAETGDDCTDSIYLGAL
ncbi:DUF6266 family protein [Chitinophaga filiformis]|uniref:Uncharacterized protein n=1 Tax=Chitinophaga filiformis TaxID=104663 RepID=A0A1G7MI75_CHIFI|nr:DUF6266 family protein [Chitinophaga filiformis]SDF60849.1 hypothetical protein SAMN04488121_102418 [Chitinophaga filiformis]